MNRRAFLRGLLGATALATVEPKRVYSFLWNNPLAGKWEQRLFYMDFVHKPLVHGSIDFSYLTDLDYELELMAKMAQMIRYDIDTEIYHELLGRR